MVISGMILRFIVSKKDKLLNPKNPNHSSDACPHKCTTNLGICYPYLVISDLIGYRFR